jgi:hypothetical protein
VDPRSAPETVLGSHASNEGEVVNRCMVGPVAGANGGSSIHAALHDANGQLWPAGQYQRFPLPRPPPSQAPPEPTVRWEKASIRTSEDAQLVAQRKTLEEEVPTRGQGCPERSDGPKGVTHRL